MAENADNQERIAELERQKVEAERELGELRGEPLTLERIRNMSPEQAGENWDQVKQFFAEDSAPTDERLSPFERLRRVKRNEGLPS